MKQTAMTILVPLASGIRIDQERQRLKKLNQTRCVEIDALLATKTIHYLSFFVTDVLQERGKTVGPAYVGLELNVDGSASAARALVVERAEGLIADIFVNCDKKNDKDLRKFLADHDCGADAYYLAFPGRSVQQIERDQALRLKVRKLYGEIVRGEPEGASTLFRRLQERFAGDSEAQATFTEPFFVRWTPRMGHFSRRASLWAKRALPPLFTAAGLAGAYALFREYGWAAAFALVLAAFVLETLGVAIGVWMGAPRQLSFRGRRLVLRSMFGTWLWGFAKLALLGGAGALLLLRLPALLPWVVPLLSPLIAVFCALFTLAFCTLFAYPWMGIAGAVALGLLTGTAFGGLYRWLHDEPGWLALWCLGLAGVLLLVAAVRVAAWLYAVRKAEAADEEGALSWDVKHLDSVQEHEDRGLQNHLATVSVLKPGKLRLQTLRRVLRLVSLLARIFFTRGDLGSIRTIHCARFLITPDERRLLFLGNYDLAFSSYLQEFNRVAGVTAVWSNTVGFPRSFLLVGDGARDEQRFKAFARRCQIPTSGWYCAYENLSIRDIEAAAATRADLQHPIEDKATLMGQTRTLFGRPLSEADCDAALRRL